MTQHNAERLYDTTVLECQWCNEMFIGVSDAKTCSDRCRQAKSRATRRGTFTPPTDEWVPMRIPNTGGKTWLYQAYDIDGKLLYVGITDNPSMRFYAHRTRSPWWQDATLISWLAFGTRAEASTAEVQAITERRPLHNKVYNPCYSNRL